MRQIIIIILAGSERGMFELGEEGVRALNLSPSIITVGPALASFSINYCVAINNPRHHGGGGGGRKVEGS